MNKTDIIRHYTDEIVSIALDDSHGYSQQCRWGSPDYDCSSLVITVLQNAGLPVKDLGATYTGNMLTPLRKVGFADVARLIDLATGQGLRLGDVLLTPGKHTEIYVGNGHIAGAHSDKDHKPGDSSHSEISVQKYYNLPWKYVLRLL